MMNPMAEPDPLLDALRTLTGRPGLIVIDEVQCISDWGHDFRPEYRRILVGSASGPRDRRRS
jgi:ATP-dependent DNA helicase RecQ